MKLTETFTARGHRNIKATHRTTLEITKEADLTPRGDCIIAVGSEKGAADISRRLVEALKRGAEATLTIEAGGVTETVRGHGDPRITLTHPTDIVVRKSLYVDSRTLMVEADKSASDLDRRLVEALRRGLPCRITVVVESEGRGALTS